MYNKLIRCKSRKIISSCVLFCHLFTTCCRHSSIDEYSKGIYVKNGLFYWLYD